jgi:hypothetical protein
VFQLLVVKSYDFTVTELSNLVKIEISRPNGAIHFRKDVLGAHRISICHFQFEKWIHAITLTLIRILAKRIPATLPMSTILFTFRFRFFCFVIVFFSAVFELLGVFIVTFGFTFLLLKVLLVFVNTLRILVIYVLHIVHV